MKTRLFKIGLILTAIMLAAGLAGCSNGNNGDETPETVTPLPELPELQADAVLSSVTIGTKMVTFQSSNGGALEEVLNAVGRTLELSDADVTGEIKYALPQTSNMASVAFAVIKTTSDTPEFTSATTGRTFEDNDILLVKVTSEDEATVRYYKIVIQAGRNANLDSLTFGGKTISTMGTPNGTWASVNPGAVIFTEPPQTYTVEAVTQSAGASAKYALLDPTSTTLPTFDDPTLSNVADLSVLAIEVTAANKTTKLYYKIKINLVNMPSEGVYYEWDPETSESFTLDENASNEDVGGKTWTNTTGTGNATGEDITFTAGDESLTLGKGRRFMIGSTNVTPTTGNSYEHTDGEFDFRTKKKLTIIYSWEEETVIEQATSFYVYLNNNTTSNANAVFPTINVLDRHSPPVTEDGAIDTDPITMVIDFDPEDFGNDASLATAFLQIRCDSRTIVKIYKILIEYQ